MSKSGRIGDKLWLMVIFDDTSSIIGDEIDIICGYIRILTDQYHIIVVGCVGYIRPFDQPDCPVNGYNIVDFYPGFKYWIQGLSEI